MRIRGIKLKALHKSKLLPALDTLLQGWEEKKKYNPLTEISAIDKFLFGAVCLCIFLVGAAYFRNHFHFQTLLQIVVISGFFMELILLCGITGSFFMVTEFTNTVNKLDGILGKYGEGINTLPHYELDQRRYLQTVLIKIAYSILTKEKDDPTDESSNLEKDRADFRNLYTITETFGFDTGRRKFLFEEARKKYSDLTATPQ